MNGTRLSQIMSGDARGAGAAMLRALLAVLEPPYRMVIALRNAMFDGRLRVARPLGRLTISIGNLTTGGTGKTPMTVEVVERLRRMGATPAVLLRGYRRGVGRSDEEMVLSESLGPDVPVVADPDRFVAAEAAIARNSAVDVFVLDDGFQHRQAHRDLDMVLIDATQPFGFEHVLPRGLLREPPAGLKRADAIIITRADQVSPDRLILLDRRIAQLTGKPPLGHAAHTWAAFYDMADESHPLEMLADKRLGAICAIGNGAAFVQMVARHAGSVVFERLLPDHHAYTQQEIHDLMAAAKAHGAEALVLTGKDWVKWKPWIEQTATPLPVYHPKLKLRMLDGDEELTGLLESVLAKRDEA